MLIMIREKGREPPDNSQLKEWDLLLESNITRFTVLTWIRQAWHSPQCRALTSCLLGRLEQPVLTISCEGPLHYKRAQLVDSAKTLFRVSPDVTRCTCGHRAVRESCRVSLLVHSNLGEWFSHQRMRPNEALWYFVLTVNKGYIFWKCF